MLRQAAVDSLAGDQQFLDRVDRDLETGLGLIVQFDLDDLLNAARADDHRHADIEVVDAVLAGEVRGAGQNALLVAQIAFRHGDGACRRA